LVKPRNRSLLAQYLAGAAVVAGAIIVPFVGPMFLVVVGFLLLVSATYPYRSQLLHYRSHEGLSLPLLAISTAAAAALLPRAAQELTWQITGRLGEHATSTAWATDAEHLVLLALAGLASATRLPGWRVLAIGCAAVYCYLGAVAIMLPDQPGSWGPAGGIAALAASVLFTVSTLMNKPGSRSRDIASAHLKSAAPA
jgi:hypothetical protein